MRLLLLITCVFSTRAWTPSENHEIKESADSFNRYKQTERESNEFNHNRKRRETNTTELECLNEMAFPNTQPKCFYDRACFTIFSDCCHDYEKRCGRQEFYEPKTSVWKCVDWIWKPGCHYSGVTGVWMVYKCPTYWSVEELRLRCENAPPKFSLQFSYPIEDHIPVIGTNGYTFRNEFCALCNGMKNYTAWNLGVSTPFLPPEGLDLNSKLKFIETNGGKLTIFPLAINNPGDFVMDEII